MTSEFPVASLERMIRFGGKPPSDPPTGNKVPIRKMLPGLLRVTDTYAAGIDESRAFVTFNTSELAADLLEARVADAAPGLKYLRKACVDEGHDDLLSLLSKAEFMEYEWPDRPATLIVQAKSKARITAVADNMGISTACAAQMAYALMWAKSGVAKGVVKKDFLPRIAVLDEAVKLNVLMVDFLRRTLETRIGRKLMDNG